MYTEKRLCRLGVEFSELDIFTRMLKIKHKRTKLLKSFQVLVDHGSQVLKELIDNYRKFLANQEVASSTIDVGLKLGNFLNEGAWYSDAIEVLKITEELCHKKGKDVHTLRQLLDCYHK